MPKATHDHHAATLLYGVLNGLLCNYKGDLVTGKAQKHNKEMIVLPNLDRYYPRIAMDISDFDTGEAIFKILRERRNAEDTILKGLESKMVANQACSLLADALAELEKMSQLTLELLLTSPVGAR